MFKRVCAVMLFSIAMAAPSLRASEAKAEEATLLIDVKSGNVLTQSNPDAMMYPASLTKMMTLYLTFEALHKGKLDWDQRLTMSENANGKIPFKFAVGVGNTISVREAVNGMIVLSANDAAAAVAEKLAGSEEAFGPVMTAKARQLGMTRTTFKNATGLTDSEQVTTARDMATLGLALMRDYPKEFKLFAAKTIQFRSMKLRGHNIVMNRYQGVDGIKTGFTDASGYNVVTSAERGGHRLLGVVMGAKSANDRDTEMMALLDQYLPAQSNKIATPATTIKPATGTAKNAPALQGSGG